MEEKVCHLLLIFLCIPVVCVVSPAARVISSVMHSHHISRIAVFKRGWKRKTKEMTISSNSSLILLTYTKVVPTCHIPILIPCTKQKFPPKPLYNDNDCDPLSIIGYFLGYVEWM